MKLKEKNNCSLFLTAGYPELDSAIKLVPELEKNGVDLIELGIPFSDPMADGPVIQEASSIALKNGMNIDLLFEQVIKIKQESQVPVVLMGYFNPVFKYGIDRFLARCKEVKIDGLIIPDLTIDIYESDYQTKFEAFGIPLIFLITPDTPEPRIRRIERCSKAFIYLVSTASVTGKRNEFTEDQIKGFERIAGLNLNVPVLVGFGIHNNATFSKVCEYFNGAIIGSAFIRSLNQKQPVEDFVAGLLNETLSDA